MAWVDPHQYLYATAPPMQRFLAQRRSVGDAVRCQSAVVVEIRARVDEVLVLGLLVSASRNRVLHVEDAVLFYMLYRSRCAVPRFHLQV